MSNDLAPDQSRKCSTLNCNGVTAGEIPKVDLNMQPLVETTARRDRAFRVPGEVNTFERPDKGMTIDLFLLLGLPWLHSVKDVIDIQKSQIKLGDRKYSEKRTFEFTKYHCLLLQPTKVSFKGALRKKPYLNQKEIILGKSKRSNALNDKNSSTIIGKEILSNDSLVSWVEESIYSSGSEVIVNDPVNRQSHKIKDYVSASTDSDLSTEDNYSPDKNSSAQNSEDSIN
ncbi:hypothetical protein EPUL_005994 [Erysiphe pulchra]|uniref:Uncharacterized protein n=1 Tax=Erysiphe pulchra TaxID=225359 RepID=A0A2S4PJT7_9PEZI|nr:hypothetical protein EPUL_005994 [Erysiphe pulchra]